MSRRSALAAIVALLAAPAPGAGDRHDAADADVRAACPLAAPERLGRPLAGVLQDADRASSSGDPACAALGRLARAALDVDATGPCELAPPGRHGEETLALRAAIAWRCGRPREAWEHAVAALRADERATLAWRVLGDVQRSRLRARSARAAYARALRLDPGEARSLWGVASLAGERGERRSRLVEYVAAAAERGEPDERADAARRRIELIDALGETPVWRVTSAALPGELPLAVLASRPGELRGFVAELPAGRRRIRALVDSGASGVHLTRRAARRLGLRPLASAELYGGGGDGEHAVERGLVPRLVVGPLTWENALGSVSERSLQRNGAFVAILGLDVFAGLRVVLDPTAPSLALARSEPADDGGDPLAGDPFATGGTGAPILLVEGQLLAEGVVRGGDGEARGLVLIDGGAPSSFVALSAARRTGGWRDVDGRAARGYGGALSMRGVVRRVVLAAAGVEGDVADLSVLDLSRRARLTGVQLVAIAGLDVLGGRRMDADLARGTLKLERTGPRGR